MAGEERSLRIQLQRGELDQQDRAIAGVARLAIDNGYATLSPAQKQLLAPYLTLPCEGVTDPGGHHNGCQQLLSGEALAAALEDIADHDSRLCENCRAEADEIEAHRQRFFD